MRFRKPRKLGECSESWLRHDVRNFACTAATCRYLEGCLLSDRAPWSEASFRLAWEVTVSSEEPLGLDV